MPPESAAAEQTPADVGIKMTEARDRIAGLLDDEGQYNPDPEHVSRGHPDYDEATDDRAQPRDERGRFQRPEQDFTDDSEPAPDMPEEDDEARDADTHEGDTDDETVETSDTEADEADADTAIETVAQLAQALDIEPQTLLDNVRVQFKAAGEDVDVTLAEVINGYQKDADYRRSTGQLAEQRRAFEAEAVERQRQVELQNAAAAGTVSAMEQVIVAQLNDPRLAELRQSDPAEWTARREELQQQLGWVQNTRQQAAANYHAFMQSERAALHDRESKALAEAIPDFGAEHKTQAKEVLSSLGLTSQEIAEVVDHRLVVGALELHRLRAENAALSAEKARATDTAKRVKKEVPKIVKPGKRQESGGVRVKQEQLAKLQRRAKKTGRTEDAAKVIEHMILS